MNLTLEELEDIQEIPEGTLLPTYRREFFSSKNREILNLVRKTSYEVCRFTISPDYVRTSLNKFKGGYMYYTDTMEVVGFTLWKENQTQPIQSSIKKPIQYIELLLICSSVKTKGLGATMMKDVERFGIQKKLDYIYLYPANDSLIDFYKKQGYKVISVFPENLKMAKELRTKESTQKTRRSRPHGTNPERMLESYKDYFTNVTSLTSQNINTL